MEFLTSIEAEAQVSLLLAERCRHAPLAAQLRGQDQIRKEKASSFLLPEIPVRKLLWSRRLTWQSDKEQSRPQFATLSLKCRIQNAIQNSSVCCNFF